MSYFSENYDELHYPISSDSEKGLRNAQLGAIHSIAAHYTLKKKTAGIVVMPTGSGKTAVLMMTPYIISAKKVLIITPSVMVRGQIYEDFSELRTLKEIRAFSSTVIPPIVYELKNTYSDDIRIEIERADVIVATPQCALSLSESAFNRNFDLVLVDEAHHRPASTWHQVLCNINDAEHILFTATPFRLDKKEIKGDLIYIYPLLMAYRDGIFGEICYIPIDEAPRKDTLIAKEAERVFLNDRLHGYDHYLMVRTDTREKAKQLEKLYEAETSLKLKRIDSTMTYKYVQSCIKGLKRKQIDGIICVDMLGEGFDFPNLKIAAVHSPHKSLAATLQFVGRFARTNAEKIGAAKFIAMNDEELVIENNRLYSSDALWQEIIIRINEKTIRKEEIIKSSLEEFVQDAAEQVADAPIPLHSLRPNCHAKVYLISSFNLYGSFPKSCCVENRVYRNKLDNTIVGIGKVNSRPRWIESDNILDVENLLYIVHFQVKTSLLFIYSQIKTEVDYMAIAESFTSEFDKIPRNEMHRVLGELQSYEMFNTGMQNRFAENGESYRIMAGSNTAASIDPTTGKMFAAGHVFCKAISAIGEDITIGYSSGSKIWSSSYMSIPEYILWCDKNGDKIANNTMVVKTNTNYDYVPMPTRISEFPEHLFFVFFSEKTFSSPPVWVNPAGEPTEVLLTDADLRILEVNKDVILISIELEDNIDCIQITIDGRYHCNQSSILLKDGRDQLPLIDYLNNHPLVFKTLNDSVIEGNEICTGVSDIIAFVPGEVLGIEWSRYHTDIRCECENPKMGMIPLQTALYKILSEKNDYSYLLYDHSTGEISDFIVITETDTAIEVVLFHVKAMHGMNYNSNLDDIYEVTQQAIKSIIWLKSRQTLLEKIRYRRRRNHCELRKGEFSELEKTLKRNKLFTAKIVIVQPAINKSVDFPSDFQEVLAATSFYIKNSGRVKSLEIWGSL